MITIGQVSAVNDKPSMRDQPMAAADTRRPGHLGQASGLTRGPIGSGLSFVALLKWELEPSDGYLNGWPASPALFCWPEVG